MSKLNDVNSRDIVNAIQMGCQTMGNIFNADDNDMPFFGSTVWPEGIMSFSGWHAESHVPGRHLNALLNAEDAIGIDVNEAVEKHRNAAFFSYSGVLPLALNRDSIGGDLVNFCSHNFREGFHALYSLVKYRQDEHAQELAERSIECILQLWNSDSGWNFDVIKEKYGLKVEQGLSLVHGFGRALGPLVKYYRATGSSRALELAVQIKDKLISDYFTAEGDFDSKLFGTHSHSVTCCMSSLAQMADLLGDGALMSNVKSFYDNGLWQIRDEIGWSPESSEQAAKGQSNHGESNNTGDIVETALILGRWGWDEYYDDAERILRAHLLPSQLRDVSFINEPANPDGVDGLKDIARRNRGAWGFPAPHGHKPILEGRAGAISFNMDIVGGVVGSLCEAYREIVRFDQLGCHVNLLFDYEGDGVRVESPYTHDFLRVRMSKTGPLWVRIPSWVDRETVDVREPECSWLWAGDRMFFPEVAAGESVTINFDLVEREITLSQNHIKPIRARFRGDEVVAMDNLGSDLTFFDAID